MDEEYTIAMEIKSETYFGKGIFFFDLAVIVGYWFVMSNFESVLHPLLTLPYTIFNLGLAFVMTRKSSKNPGKRIYQSFLYRLLATKGKAWYFPERNPEAIVFLDLEEE